MYDLDVAIVDTFAVGDGAWVVHNCDDDDVISILYRGDYRTPDEIRDAGGFHPDVPGATGNPLEIASHVTGELNSVHYGKYVSTTVDEDVAIDFVSDIPRVVRDTRREVSYIYRFKNPGGGINVQTAYEGLIRRGYISTLTTMPPTVLEESEIAFGPGGIPTRLIEAYRKLTPTDDFDVDVGPWQSFR